MKQMPREVLDETLSKMAELVRTQPTITVRELASRLGFAEARSIYYWLEKAGYDGIRDFREDILRTAAEDGKTGGSTLPVRERVHRLDELPVRALTIPRGRHGGRAVREAAEPFEADRGSSAPARPRFDPTRSAPAPTPWVPAVGAGAYALTVEHQGYAPAVLRGDILIVDPRGEWQDGDMVVVERSGGSIILSRAYGADSTLLVHLAHPEQILQVGAADLGEPYRIAPVVQLIRSFR